MSEFRSDFGEQIMDLVDNALNSDNFEKLNKQISNILNGTIGTGSQQKPRNGQNTQYRQNGQNGPYRQNSQNGQNAYRRTGGPNTGYSQPGGPYSQANRQNRPGYTSQYQNRQNDAMNASNAGRAAYEARRRNMMAGQPHDSNMGVRPNQTAASAKAAAAVTQNPYFANPQGEAAGTLMKIIGGIGSAGMLISTIRAVFTLVAGGGIAPLVTALLGLFIAATVFLLGLGVGNRAKRYKKYVALLKKKLYASVRDLGAEVGKSDEFVRKDLKRMIEKRQFKQGHLDDKETTMIATDELYQQYRRTQEQADRLKQEQEEIEKQYGALSKDVREVLDKGNDYIEKIRECNMALPEKEISEKLTRLENIISKIFARVKEQPGEARNLSQFMDYYLPTTWKLVSAYREMAEQPVQGENIRSAQQEIRDSLDTINDAFETLLDSMFKEQAWDVSTDISVMKSMMKQDGLTGRDFEKPAQGSAKAVKNSGNVAIMEEQ